MIKRAIGAIVVLVCCGAMTAVGTLRGSAQSISGVQLTNNLAGIPSRSDITVQPLEASVNTVSAATAIATAEKVWGFPQSSVDSSVGVVRSRFSLAGNQQIQNIPALIVVANLQTPMPGPMHGVYNKMAIVVDALTGGPVISLPFDPGPTS